MSAPCYNFEMRWWLGILMMGCASPLPIERRDYVVGQVAARYHEFYPADGDPDPARDSGLLQPRFGLPAIAKDSFEVVLLERGKPPAPRVLLCREQCWPAELSDRKATPVEGGFEEVRYTARAAAPPGAYDLVLQSPADAPTRAPRAVWLREEDPAAPRPLRVVQLNDLHIGKHVGHLEEHLQQVVYDINQLHPDLVIVTGDLVNIGTERDQPPRAQKLLRQIDAPVVTVLGNHDLGFDSFSRVQYGPGWSNFARSFHAALELAFTLGGWRFVGFDSGPSTFSPRILTRGLLPPAVAELGKQISDSAALRGVVLFSHAPTRAAVSGDQGPFGRMKWGARELEQLMLQAAAHGQRVLHLAGHTHWSDLFEDQGGRFVRWRQLSPCMKPVAGKAALITTQAAGHAGVSFKESAHGWGFTELLLDGDVHVAFHRYGLPDDPWVCAKTEVTPAGSLPSSEARENKGSVDEVVHGARKSAQSASPLRREKNGALGRPCLPAL
jgi:Icc-related predicted phosphoesterase